MEELRLLHEQKQKLVHEGTRDAEGEACGPGPGGESGQTKVFHKITRYKNCW